MSDNDTRNPSYWLHQIWHAVTGGIAVVGDLTVKIKDTSTTAIARVQGGGTAAEGDNGVTVHDPAIGLSTHAEATGNGSAIAILKRIRTLLGSGIAVSISPATSGGYAAYRNLDLNTTGVVVKAGAGQVYGWAIYNNNTATRYFKFYNKASAPVVGDSALIVFVLALPPTSLTNIDWFGGIAFSTGIGARATTGVADADTGVPSTNDVVAAVFYK
jgi:hypothetical protein